MSGLAEAVDGVVADVAANAGNDGQRQFARDHHRALLDMQFEKGAHAPRVEQRLLAADGVEVGAGAEHAVGECFAGIALDERQVVGVEQAEEGARTDVGLAEPGAFFAAEGDDLQRQRRAVAGASLRKQAQ